MDDAYLSHSPERTLDCRVCGARAAPDSSYRELGLYRCPSCSFLFAPAPNEHELQKLYGDEYFDDYAEGEPYEEDEVQRRYEARIRVALLERHLGGGRLLEIGAAAGYFLDEARKAGFDCVGIEPAPGVAARARERFGLDVIAGFIEKADLPGRGFDAACAWHVVEHLAEPLPALSRVRGWLRPGGYLLIEVPNVESVYARRKGPGWLKLDPDHHLGHYGPRPLARLLERSGFELLETETFPGLGYFRPARALGPTALAMQAKELVSVRARPRHPHPTKHELLRAVARVPS
jgi:SAM-dependent methyltransferase